MKALRELRRRVVKLERGRLRLRQGTMTAADAVAIGANLTSHENVEVLGGLAADGDRVSVLSKGKDHLVLGHATPAGQILGYAEDATGTFSTTSTTKGGALWTALTVEVTLTRETLVEAYAFTPAASNNNATGTAQMWIFIDGDGFTSDIVNAPAVNEGCGLKPIRSKLLAPGEYVFTVRVNALVAGTASFLADDPVTGVAGPATLTVRSG